MFRIQVDQTYPFPVDVRVPSDAAPGQFATHRFTALFRVLPTDEARALLAKPDSLDRDLLGQVLVGWRDVADEDGQPLPFGDEARDRLCRDPRVQAALVDAYRKSISGEAVAARREGN
ncbi:MAG TPA: hypothetical protein VED40_10510 [Azospirillaceae bacterium]|nr:hypothetical protein [Azospirillaceae bacterium]